MYYAGKAFRPSCKIQSPLCRIVLRRKEIKDRKEVKVMEQGQALHGSPYVEQIEKLSHSLRQLSQTFTGLEEKRQSFSSE